MITFIVSVILIAIVSVLLAVISLKKTNNISDIDKVKSELSKGKVIFKEGYSSSSNSKSSDM